MNGEKNCFLDNLLTSFCFCIFVPEKIGLVTENEATERRRKLGEENTSKETRKEAFEVPGETSSHSTALTTS